MNIRSAEIADAASIAHVHVASWKTTYAGLIPQGYLDALDAADGALRWEQRLRDNTGSILVAEDASGIFGFAAGGHPLHPVEGYDAELIAIYLLVDKQRSGAGRQLVQRLARDLQRDGFRSLVVWALRENAACDFYQRLGGTLIGEKSIEIGGVMLPEVAYGWPNIGALLT